MSDRIFTRSQLRDTKFFKEHQKDIELALREGRVDPPTKTPKATVDQRPGVGKRVFIDAPGPRVEPPATETARTGPPNRGGTDFGSLM